jgi:hypothetical protein
MTTGGDDVEASPAEEMFSAGYPVTGRNARFAWERALRDGGVPRYLMGFLLLIGTYMNNDGTNAIPSTAKLTTQFGLSRQRVFELLAEAETAGWLITRARPGKPSERLPATPMPVSGQLVLVAPEDVTPPLPPDVTRQTRLTGTRQTGLTGEGVADPDPSDGSDGSRQTHLTGTPDPSDGSDPTEEIGDP